jgi:hypothetical protein
VQITERYTPFNRPLPLSKDKFAKWKMENKPGDLCWERKESLIVDHSYQRNLNETKYKKIASSFNWAAFGALIVAQRPDGKLYVVDGQHRLSAAMARPDIDIVPCIVFVSDGDIVSEASDFLTINKNRKPLTGTESFKALVVSENKTAKIVQSMIDEQGLQVGKSGTSKNVSCVKALMTCVENDQETIKKIWPLIVRVCRGHTVDHRIVRGMHFTEKFLVDELGNKRSLTETENRKKLLEIGYDELHKAIYSSVAYHKTASDRTWSEGILNAMNHRKRNKLKTDTSVK